MELIDNALLFITLIAGSFGWGMFAQELITKRFQRKAKVGRIVVDAPFSREQSDTIMRVLQELNDAVQKSMEGK